MVLKWFIKKQSIVDEVQLSFGVIGIGHVVWKSLAIRIEGPRGHKAREALHHEEGQNVFVETYISCDCYDLDASVFG